MKNKILLTAFIAGMNITSISGEALKVSAVFVIGKAQMIHELRAKKLQPGMAVPEGAKIQTGYKSAVILQFSNGNKVKIGANSILLVEDYSKNDAKYGTKTQLSLQNGKVSSYVKFFRGENYENKFKVKTPTVVAGVRGSAFDTLVTGGQTTTTSLQSEITNTPAGYTSAMSKETALLKALLNLKSQQKSKASSDTGISEDLKVLKENVSLSEASKRKIANAERNQKGLEHNLIKAKRIEAALAKKNKLLDAKVNQLEKYLSKNKSYVESQKALNIAILRKIEPAKNKMEETRKTMDQTRRDLYNASQKMYEARQTHLDAVRYLNPKNPNGLYALNRKAKSDYKKMNSNIKALLVKYPEDSKLYKKLMLQMSGIEYNYQKYVVDFKKTFNEIHKQASKAFQVYKNSEREVKVLNARYQTETTAVNLAVKEYQAGLKSLEAERRPILNNIKLANRYAANAAKSLTTLQMQQVTLNRKIRSVSHSVLIAQKQVNIAREKTNAIIMTAYVSAAEKQALIIKASTPPVVTAAEGNKLTADTKTITNDAKILANEGSIIATSVNGTTATENDVLKKTTDLPIGIGNDGQQLQENINSVTQPAPNGTKKLFEKF